MYFISLLRLRSKGVIEYLLKKAIPRKTLNRMPCQHESLAVRCSTMMSAMFHPVPWQNLPGIHLYYTDQIRRRAPEDTEYHCYGYESTVPTAYVQYEVVEEQAVIPSPNYIPHNPPSFLSIQIHTRSRYQKPKV